MAIALSRGRVQLHGVECHTHQARRAISSVSSASSSSNLTSMVSAEWIAHSGPITCMSARPPAAAAAATVAATNTKSLRRDTAMRDELAEEMLLLAQRPATLVTGGGDGKVKVWTDEGRAGGLGAEQDIVDSTEIHDRSGRRGGKGGTSIRQKRRGTGHEGAVLCVCWHPGGEMLASAGQDWAIWLWDAEGRAMSYVHAHRRWTQALAFSASGDFLVSCAGKGFAGWDVSLAGDDDGDDDDLDTRQQPVVCTICWRRPANLTATQAEASIMERGREFSSASRYTVVFYSRNYTILWYRAIILL